MGDVKFENNAVTTLLSSVGIGDTTFVVSSAATFPVLGAGDWMYTTIASEFVKVTGTAGATFTCEPITVAHDSGVPVELRMCKELLDDFSTDVELEFVNSSLDNSKANVEDLYGSNILINPEGLVNQEGYVDGAATTKDQNIFDMWKVSRSVAGNCLKVTRSNGTIQLDNDVPGSDQAWVQQENDDIHAFPDGTTMTLSGEVTAMTGNLSLRGLGLEDVVISTGAFSSTFVKDTSDVSFATNPFLMLILSAGESVTVKNLKLELGSVATNYSSPQITEEELKCYRYLWRLSNIVSTYDYNLGVGLAQTGSLILFRIKTAVKMRGVAANISVSTNSVFEEPTGSGIINAFSIESDPLEGGHIMISGTGVISATPGESYFYRADLSTFYFQIDARYWSQ